MHRVKRSAARACLLLLNVVLLVRYRRLGQRFFEKMRRLPNFAAPVTFTEKIHWRKIFDDDPRFAVVLDKLRAKDIVSGSLPWLRFPRVLWQGVDARNIPFDELTVPYIVKCSHGCGMNIAVPNPAIVDREAIVARMSENLGETYGAKQMERAYAHIEPRVFVEALVGRDQGYEPVDYKFCVVGGRVAYIIVVAFRSSVKNTAHLDRDWHPLEIVQGELDSTLEIPPPKSLSRMIEAAEALGSQFDMMRVDFYEDEGEPVFGEFTVYPRSGLLQFDPATFDHQLGTRWNIAGSNYLTNPPNRFARLYKRVLVAADHLPG